MKCKILKFYFFLKYNEFLKIWSNWILWFWNYLIYKGGILNCYNWYVNIIVGEKILYFLIFFVKSILNVILDIFWKINGLLVIVVVCISCVVCYIFINNFSVGRNYFDVIWF